MLNCAEVLEVVNEKEGLPILIKKRNSGEVLIGSDFYIADEVIFLFASKEEKEGFLPSSTTNLMKFIDNESNDPCWNDSISIPNGIDSSELDNEEIYCLKRELLTENLPFVVYYGDLNDCPLNNQNEVSDIKDAKIIEGNLVLSI